MLFANPIFKFPFLFLLGYFGTITISQSQILATKPVQVIADFKYATNPVPSSNFGKADDPETATGKRLVEINTLGYQLGKTTFQSDSGSFSQNHSGFRFQYSVITEDGDYFAIDMSALLQLAAGLLVSKDLNSDLPKSLHGFFSPFIDMPIFGGRYGVPISRKMNYGFKQRGILGIGIDAEWRALDGGPKGEGSVNGNNAGSLGLFLYGLVPISHKFMYKPLLGSDYYFDRDRKGHMIMFENSFIYLFSEKWGVNIQPNVHFRRLNKANENDLEVKQTMSSVRLGLAKYF